MNLSEVVGPMVEQKLLRLHTLFVGKVTVMKDKRVSVQPLALTQDQGGPAQKQPLIPEAYIVKGLELEAGDVVLCAVCERDISHVVYGEFAMPEPRHHSLSDTVVIGVMDV